MLRLSLLFKLVSEVLHCLFDRVWLQVLKVSEGRFVLVLKVVGALAGFPVIRRSNARFSDKMVVMLIISIKVIRFSKARLVE